MHVSSKSSLPGITPLVTAEVQQENESNIISTRNKLSQHTINLPIPRSDLHVPKRSFRQTCCSKESLKEQALLMATIGSVIVGIAVGIALRSLKCSTDEQIDGCRITKDDITYIEFPGTIFISILKLLILPLIVSSIISSLAQLDTQSSGKLGLRALVYYFGTTILAAVIGIILVLSIRPGTRVSKPEFKSDSQAPEGRTIDTILDLFRNLFPDNIVQASFQTSGTKLSVNKIVIQRPNDTSYNKTMYKAVIEKRDGINVLGLLLFCVLFGIIVSRLKEKTIILRKFFEAMLEVVMQLVHLAMIFSPIGIFFLIVAKILSMDNLNDFVGSLGLYMATVLGGLFIHGVILLPLILFIVTRMNVFKYIRGMSQALVTAFGTASSSATLPVTYRCVEEKNHIDPRVSRFVLPLGATVNMDGTALYEAVAALYIAQVNNVPLTAVKIIVTVFTSTLASVGAASIPQAGLVTLVMVLNALGLPAEEVRTIFAVDWFLDRFRTAINVFGDSIGCAIVEHLSRKELDALDNRNLFIESTNPSVVYPNLPLLDSVHRTSHISNRVSPTTYDNPAFLQKTETIVDEDDNSMAQTSF